MSDAERSLYDDVTEYLLEPSLYAFSGRQRRLLPVTGLGVVILSEQRTVWAATIASLACLYYFSIRVGARRTKRALSAAIALGIAAVTLAIATGTGGLGKSLETAYGSSFKAVWTSSRLRPDDR